MERKQIDSTHCFIVASPRAELLPLNTEVFRESVHFYENVPCKKVRKLSAAFLSVSPNFGLFIISQQCHEQSVEILTGLELNQVFVDTAQHLYLHSSKGLVLKM